MLGFCFVLADEIRIPNELCVSFGRCDYVTFDVSLLLYVSHAQWSNAGS